jgi:hypothetical protein
MKSEAIVMTLDFGKDHFNAILLGNQLKLVSSNGGIITLPGDTQKTLPEQAGQALNQLIDFFKRR